MKVILAGYNVDADLLKDLPGVKTPETISAAYARISRSSRPIPELREEARKEVGLARRSAKRIIYDMGHHSVAEHSVFNFDILDVSRLAVEEIERFRLVSYTEKSQRYVKFEKGFFIPEEIKSTPYEKEYLSLIEEQFNYYETLVEKLKSARLKSNPNMKEKEAENRAKEDARFCLPLATLTQLGMTINARNLEYLLRNFAASPLREIRELGEKLFSSVAKIAPSLFLFYQATPYERRGEDIEELARKILSKKERKKDKKVHLINYNPNSDSLIALALLYPYSQLPLEELAKLTKGKEEEIFQTALRHLEFYDALPREFEFSFLIFEITLSASAFAQLKRHRLATLIKRPYSPKLGYVLPKSIREIGEEKKFAEIIKKTNQLFAKWRREFPKISFYILTNAHKRQVLLGLNARELYHIVRLRSDASAQWEIKEISNLIAKEAKKKLPLTFFLLAGKDKYPALYKKVFGQLPKSLLPKS